MGGGLSGGWAVGDPVSNVDHRLAVATATSDHPVERVAAQVGFGSPTVFREGFGRTTGVGPHACRRSFGRPRAGRP
ncbi:helix-turn-helix transcriptional regulator [Streptomyces adustus]|uniref:Helix-turn-helix transcriptional regulator n=1 Tax=Streptomyces adustus TaxID=1609272 RepID=A0A5N8VLC1_9ACTN|nr:helix-turn-helix transcriptional regulator [Streptomyces adustus]